MNLKTSNLADLTSLFEQPGKQMEAKFQAEMELAFGADFSNVKIYESPLALSIGALGFTFGDNICCAPGFYEPDTPRGRHLIAHELVHVLQQRNRRIEPKVIEGIEIVADEMLEEEASNFSKLACEPGARNLMGAYSCAPPIKQARFIQKIEEIPVWNNRTVRGTTNYVLVSNTTLLIHNNMTGGSGPNNTLRPSGFISGECPYHHQRGHLIGNNLGGTGNSLSNLVTLTEGTNHPFMYEYEEEIRKHVQLHHGETFLYQVDAFYDESEYTPVQKPIPQGAPAGSNFGAAGNPYCDFPCPSHLVLTFLDTRTQQNPLSHRFQVYSTVGKGVKIMNGIYKFHQVGARHIAGRCWAVS